MNKIVIKVNRSFGEILRLMTSTLTAFLIYRKISHNFLRGILKLVKARHPFTVS